MNEKIKSTQEYLDSNYQQAAQSLATIAFGKFKDVRAKGREFSMADWEESLTRTNTNLQKQLNFPPDSSRLNYLALEQMMLLKDQEPDMSTPGAAFFNDQYLLALKNDIIESALASGDDFHDVLGQKLRQLSVRGVNLDNKLINDLKSQWANEYYDKLSNAN